MTLHGWKGSEDEMIKEKSIRLAYKRSGRAATLFWLGVFS